MNAGSVVHTQHNAQKRGVYAAFVSGKNGAELYVRVGGSDVEWQPSHSNYRDYREYAAGSGWKVWVKLPRNPPVKQAALAGALPVPVYKEPGTMQVPDALVGE